jgi:hypothetical protein
VQFISLRTQPASLRCALAMPDPDRKVSTALLQVMQTPALP